MPATKAIITKSYAVVKSLMPFNKGFTVKDIEVCDFSVSTSCVITVLLFHHLRHF